MYDIKIFLEEDGQFGAQANLGKEKIYENIKKSLFRLYLIRSSVR